MYLNTANRDAYFAVSVFPGTETNQTRGSCTCMCCSIFVSRITSTWKTSSWRENQHISLSANRPTYIVSPENVTAVLLIDVEF